MNTLDGLKKLLGKLGGDPDSVNNNGDAVDAIATNYADHVGAVIDDTKASDDTVYSSNKVVSIIPAGLPTVSSADSGKILSVANNGKWVKADFTLRGRSIDVQNTSGTLTVTFPEGVNRAKLTTVLGATTPATKQEFVVTYQSANVSSSKLELSSCTSTYGVFSGIAKASGSGYKKVTVLIGVNSTDDAAKEEDFSFS